MFYISYILEVRSNFLDLYSHFGGTIILVEGKKPLIPPSLGTELKNRKQQTSILLFVS